ncbi:hypothetical protein ES288_D06G117300v1 [Gossypium darwinii]|uniref:JAB1/MPN/MOV34 metalloenzyme domain-containing protein n=1 Tax=Gossypium darwinii TaxID=34276 RepID=A0A5D2C8H6_GOSDA|nr:hypothetical protein ES288_D06G117300v1 [Gossypium darwinii]
MENFVNSNDFLMNSKSSSSRKQKLWFNLVSICIVFIIWQYMLDKKVFPHFYILGWYSTGSDAQESDMHIHRALMDINESLLYVLLNPAINPTSCLKVISDHLWWCLQRDDNITNTILGSFNNLYSSSLFFGTWKLAI